MDAENIAPVDPNIESELDEGVSEELFEDEPVHEAVVEAEPMQEVAIKTEPVPESAVENTKAAEKNREKEAEERKNREKEMEELEKFTRANPNMHPVLKEPLIVRPISVGIFVRQLHILVAQYIGKRATGDSFSAWVQNLNAPSNLKIHIL